MALPQVPIEVLHTAQIPILHLARIVQMHSKLSLQVGLLSLLLLSPSILKDLTLEQRERTQIYLRTMTAYYQEF